MARPSEYPEWASDPGAGIVEPSSGEKETGWVPGQEPPAQYMNWLQNLAYLWIEWLDEQDIAQEGRLDDLEDGDHDDRFLPIPVAAAGYLNTGVAVDPTTGAFITLGTATTDPSVTFPLLLAIDERVTNVDVYINKTSASGTVTARARRVDVSSGTVATIASATNNQNNPGRVTLSITFDFTISSGFLYWLDVVGGGVAGDSVYGALVTYDHP